MASLYETASRLHDPRVKGRSNHLLADIVILAVLAVGSGADYIRRIRNHWTVENFLHRVLDMPCGEDRQRKRAGMSAENFTLVRKFPLNILKRDKGMGSIVAKHLKAGWSIDFLFSLLVI